MHRDYLRHGWNAITRPTVEIRAAVKPHAVRNSCSMRYPERRGPMIMEIDVSDCVKPSTTPCSSAPAACVIRLVKAGRTSDPIDITAVAAPSDATDWQNAKIV